MKDSNMKEELQELRRELDSITSEV